jgi:hypothetical protein
MNIGYGSGYDSLLVYKGNVVVNWDCIMRYRIIYHNSKLNLSQYWLVLL